MIKGAPSNVRAAFKALLSFADTVPQCDPELDENEQAFWRAFETLGKDPKLVTDGTTISNWYTAVCGGTLTTTPPTVASP